MTPNELLDLARTAINGNDATLARRLNIGRQIISGWRKADRPIPDHQIVELAQLAKLDPAQTLAEISAAQAETTHPKVAQTWAEIARRAANTKRMGNDETAPNLYLMSTQRDHGARERRHAPSSTYTGQERRAA